MKKYILSAVLIGCLVLSTGCGNSTHPNQINAFDGDTYDALTVAHSALVSLRAQVVSQYPKYTADFNTTAATYNTTSDTYALFRSAPTQNQAQVSAEIGNLTVSVVALENAIQADLHVAPAAVVAARAQALAIRQKLGGKYKASVSLTDILTDLEIAASIAQAVPGASPYAALASVVIQATSAAVSAIQASAGTPIDLSTIAHIAAI